MSFYLNKIKPVYLGGNYANGQKTKTESTLTFSKDTETTRGLFSTGMYMSYSTDIIFAWKHTKAQNEVALGVHYLLLCLSWLNADFCQCSFCLLLGRLIARVTSVRWKSWTKFSQEVWPCEQVTMGGDLKCSGTVPSVARGKGKMFNYTLCFINFLEPPKGRLSMHHLWM